MKKHFFIVFWSFFAFCPRLFGADITVPNLELASRGAVEDGNFGIKSSLKADISITGGYKYGFSIGLGAEIPNLEKALSYGRLDLPTASSDPLPGSDHDEMVKELNDRYNNQAVLSIRSVKATVREVFDTPLEISFFIGYHDSLGSGDEFQEYYGTDPIGTGFRGFFYYPDGLNHDPFFRFNGAIHSIKGTGLAFKAVLGNFIPALYIYHDLSFPENQLSQNGSYEPGRYSADLKLLANGENAKFEVFFGGTYANHDKTVLRGGALAWFGSGPLSLLMQAGVSYYEVESSMEIDNCYFLMEPRLRFDKIGANLTFFYHPVYYMNRIIQDDANKPVRGSADINLRIFFGNIQKSAFEAGLETTANLKIEDKKKVGLWVSPFISVVTSGLRWDIALRFNPKYKWEGENPMEGFIGIRTSY